MLLSSASARQESIKREGSCKIFSGSFRSGSLRLDEVTRTVTPSDKRRCPTPPKNVIFRSVNVEKRTKIPTSSDFSQNRTNFPRNLWELCVESFWDFNSWLNLAYVRILIGSIHHWSEKLLVYLKEYGNIQMSVRRFTSILKWGGE